MIENSDILALQKFIDTADLTPAQRWQITLEINQVMVTQPSIIFDPRQKQCVMPRGIFEILRHHRLIASDLFPLEGCLTPKVK